MTFLDALRTGKPMRRAGWCQWHVMDEPGFGWLELVNGTNGLGMQVALKREDYLADDWDVSDGE